MTSVIIDRVFKLAATSELQMLLLLISTAFTEMIKSRAPYYNIVYTITEVEQLDWA